MVEPHNSHESISGRVIYVCLKINNKYSVKVIQAYAPTSTHDDEEVEQFYEDVEKAMDEDPSHYQYLIGDFNAKLGKREEEFLLAISASTEETNVEIHYSISYSNTIYSQ